MLVWCAASGLALLGADAGSPDLDAGLPLGAVSAAAELDASSGGGLDAGSAEPDAAAAVLSNDCCTVSSSAACDDVEVLACVCAGDAFCCDVAYDTSCVRQAASRCGQDCDARVPVSDCCGASEVPGCAAPQVASCVCAVDPFCCAFRFDESCVNLARAQCQAVCPAEEATP
jgi:hypothetical protein